MKKITLTIGIPAFNEENNIKKLIVSIMNQKMQSFILDKIIVISDGSTDDTNKIVVDLSKNFKFIKLIADKKRLGKSRRINTLFKESESDVLALIDSDTILEDKNSLENFISEFKQNKKNDLVAFCDRPFEAKTIISKAINANINLWNNIRENINEGNSIHNIHGCGYALSKNVYKKIIIPKEIFNDDEFVYMFVKKNKYKFLHCCAAKLKYYAPSTFKDFILQSSRFSNSREKIIEYFGKNTEKEFNYSSKIKHKYTILSFINNPIYMSLGFLLFIMLRFLKKNYREDYTTGYWNVIKSTKLSFLVSL